MQQLHSGAPEIIYISDLDLENWGLLLCPTVEGQHMVNICL